MRPAAQRWAEALDSWAIPQEILDAAPESPWGHPPSLFKRHPGHGDTDTPSLRRALEALDDGDTVLDVGVGAGASSLPVAPPAARIVGVDASADMLQAFSEEADAAGVQHLEVHGTWSEVAPRVEIADVVVCHHVFYNVRGLAPFVEALTDHARKRVVVELTDTHPQSALNDLWLHFHNLKRPSGPTATDAAAVVEELGFDPHIEMWERQPRWGASERADVVAFVRKRLCLSADRDEEIDRLLGPRPVLSPLGLATMWWPGRALNAPRSDF
jgi:SAM-dependent methyltransferase